MQFFIFIIISFIGTVIHYYFLPLNDILKNADSFAYLQMASNLAQFKLEGFGTGWFGFLYSLFIAPFSFLFSDVFVLAKLLNLAFFAIGGLFLYKISRKYLNDTFVFIPLVLYYLSSSLIFFNIQALSENIYIPIFLALFYGLQKFSKEPNFIKSIGIGAIFTLMYFTRAEAFIYIGSVFLIFLFLIFAKKINFKEFSLYFATIIISFFLLISPYIYYMHTITGEWGLTNKGSSNLRQATMRGIDKMDDSGFEQAVGELTPDKHHLIAGFAGGLQYDKSYSTGSTKDFLIGNPSKTINRIKENQIKLYSQNIPKILVGDYLKLAFDKTNSLYLRIFYISTSLLFLFSFLGGFYYFFRNNRNTFLVVFFSFFLTASFFFTIFFVLDRYFIIFLPIAFIFCAYFLENIKSSIKQFVFFVLFLAINISGLVIFYSENSRADSDYNIKKVAGNRIQENYSKKDNDGKYFNTDTKIMERWPITTFYAGSKERWLTPYTDNLPDIIKYASYNNIDLLIVDNMDFATYRPGLKALLEGKDNYFGIEKVKEFQDWDKKLIIYKFKR
ncbi:MAG: hypothetical protein PHG82_01895 [Candidatus Gracilibacteria bacterium]|nr:hypothetical protein [Candidatus Gracilibacteria bacterium]